MGPRPPEPSLGPPYVSRLAHAAAKIVVNLIDNLIQDFARFGRHVAFSEGVARVLVFADVIHFHLDPQLVERILEVHFFKQKAFNVHHVVWGNINFVRHGSQIIFVGTRALQIGVDRLAGFLEFANLLANFLKLRPTGTDTARLKNYRLHTLIFRRLTQRCPKSRTVGVACGRPRGKGMSTGAASGTSPCRSSTNTELSATRGLLIRKNTADREQNDDRTENRDNDPDEHPEKNFAI